MNTNAESKRNEYEARGRTVAFHKRQGLAKVRTPSNNRHTEGNSRVERTRGKQAVLVCLLCVRGRPAVQAMSSPPWKSVTTLLRSQGTTWEPCLRDPASPFLPSGTGGANRKEGP